MRTSLMASIVLVALLAACSRTPQQQDFSSAEEAVQALAAAAKASDRDALLKVLGEEAAPVVDSGDAVQDKNGRERFAEAFERAHTLESVDDVTRVLEVGDDKWPFPFPIVQTGGRWHFDSSAGVDEIVNRRVGANELATIQSCLAFVDAQHEYYSRNPQGDSLLQFSQKLVSTQGQKDGLYWPTSGDEPPSPLGESFAAARGEGYFEKGTTKDTPYHGYVYRLLTSQGQHARGGAYDYLVNGKMLGGFALIAVPADYGRNGVVTFMVNQDGVVYSKDLGPETPQVAAAIAVFDPDPSWKREAAISDP